PMVVLADKYDRQLPKLGEIERFVEGADVCRPVAKESKGHPGLMTHSEGECCADRCRQAAAYDRVRTHRAALDVVEVHRAAIAMRASLGLAVQLRHHLIRRCAIRKYVPMGAVRRRHDVALAERVADADRDRLLA